MVVAEEVKPLDEAMVSGSLCTPCGGGAFLSSLSRQESIPCLKFAMAATAEADGATEFEVVEQGTMDILGKIVADPPGEAFEATVAGPGKEPELLLLSGGADNRENCIGGALGWVVIMAEGRGGGG